MYIKKCKLFRHFLYILIVIYMCLPILPVSAVLGLTEDQSYDIKEDENSGVNDSIKQPGSLPDKYTGKVTIKQDKGGTLSISDEKVSDEEKISLESTWNEQIDKYRYAIVGITGFSALTMLLIFIKLSIRLASCESHPMLRNQTIKGMCGSAIACALLGSITIYVSLVYHIFM